MRERKRELCPSAQSRHGLHFSSGQARGAPCTLLGLIKISHLQVESPVGDLSVFLGFS